jgi:hypothetical protein
MKTDFAPVAPGGSNNPPRVRRDRSRPVVLVGFLLLIATLVFVVRPLSHRSPTIDILGSYFPAWMVCILTGLNLTLIAHWFVQLGNLKPYLGPLPLIYPCLMIIFTFATWILFYQN